MFMTIAICTYNRSDLLRKTLRSMVEIFKIDNNIEVVVVNNNSNDDSQAVIDACASSIPLRSFIEREQGLCAARNRALLESSGEIVVFCDDDVIVSSFFVQAYRRAAQRWPDAGFFFGRVIPKYEKLPLPHVRVVLDELAGGSWLGFDLSCSERVLGPEEFGRGANMAIRRTAAEGLHFNAAFGRNRNQVLFGDETAYCAEIRRRGYIGVWVPDASLQHLVPSQRISQVYLESYFRGLGTSMVRQGLVNGKPQFAGVPRWILRSYVEYWVEMKRKYLMGDMESGFRAQAMGWKIKGIIDEMRSERRFPG